MAARPVSPPPPQSASRSIEQAKRGMARVQKRIEDLENFDPQSVQKRWAAEVKTLQIAIDEALTLAFGHNTVEYNRYKDAARLEPGGISHEAGVLMSGGNSNQTAAARAQDAIEAKQHVAEGKRKALVLLRQALRSLKEETEEQEQHGAAATASAAATPSARKVFVVHGHDEPARETVARFVEKLGFEAIILHERPNKGRTIITKFREEAGDVGFAAVLMTADDAGGVAGAPVEQLRPRARQNVVFELGFFIGALGPERVAALVRGNVERPSDFDGVVYISLDNGNWKADLARELEAAGYDIDWNKAMRA